MLANNADDVDGDGDDDDDGDGDDDESSNRDDDIADKSWQELFSFIERLHGIRCPMCFSIVWSLISQLSLVC